MTTAVRAASLSVEGLTYTIQGKKLLDNVSLRVGQGELVGMIGPNGAGKSTLLRVLAGVIEPSDGERYLEGHGFREMPSRERARAIALVPQVAPMAHGFTCLELVLMGRYPHMGRFQIEGALDENIARQSMRLTDTEQFTDRTLETLSGGERQRVFIARALAQQPRVLLLDEPTSNLDILHQLRVLGLIRRWALDGATAIAAVHDLNMAARHCDFLILLSKGRVVAVGAPEDVLTAENISGAYGVESVVYRDPHTGALMLSLLGPSEDMSEYAAD